MALQLHLAIHQHFIILSALSWLAMRNVNELEYWQAWVPRQRLEETEKEKGWWEKSLLKRDLKAEIELSSNIGK